jgi:hypothetical protein
MKKKANRSRRGTAWAVDDPSPASLRAIPEADFTHVKVSRSSYAERIRKFLL